MQQRNPWDNDAIVPAGGGMVITKVADPGRQYEGPTKAAQLDHIRLENARLAREAAQTGDDGGTLDPATRTYYAQQVLAGAPMPSLGMGKQAAASKQAIMAEVARLAGASGLNGADQAAQLAHYKAGSGQIANLEKMAGTIGVNEQTALANGQQFLDRSRELPGQTRFQPLNAISDFIQRKFGGTTISAADAAYNTFVNEYAKVVAGSPSGAGVLSDSARHEAMSTISGSGSVEQKQAAFDQMKADMANRMVAIHGGISGAYKALTQQPGYQVPDSTQGLVGPGVAVSGGPTGGNGPGAPPSGGMPSGVGIGSGPGGMTIDPAKQAIARQIEGMLSGGRPDDEVMAFAKNAGADPASIQANLDFRRQHPRYQGGYNASDIALVPKAPVRMSLNGGTGALGTYAMNAAQALTGNTLDNMTADPALARAGLAGASAANPGSATLGELTGGGLAALGSELGAGAALGRAGVSTASPWVARAGDALYGAFSGAGGADDGSRLGGAALGAGSGVAGGMFGRGVAAPALSAVFRPVTTAAKNRLGALGYDVGAAAPAALTPAEAMATSAARKIGPDSMFSQLEEASRLGVPMAPVDTGAALRSLGGAAVRRSPAAAQIAENALLPRARGQIDRFGQAVEMNLGPVGNIPQISADLTQQARTAAGPLYDRAYASPVISTPELDATLNTPFGRQALARARTIAANERRNPAELGFAQDADGNVVLNPRPNQAIADHLAARDELNAAQEAYKATRGQPGASTDNARQRVEAARQGLRDATTALDRAPDPSMPASVPGYTTQTLDYVKRGMDDVLEQQRNPLTGRLVLDEAGRAQNQARNQFVNEVDRLNPAYAQARAAYAGPASARSAMESGQDAFTANPNQLGVDLTGASPERLAQMQLGYRGALMDKANSVRTSTNPFDATLGTPAAEQRLGMMFRGSPGVAPLLRTRDLEGTLARTNNKILGNSDTAERQLADQAFGAGALPAAALDAGMMAVGGVPTASIGRALAGGGLRDAMTLGLGKRAVAKADALAPILFNTDPADSLGIVRGLLAKDDAYRNYINRLPSRRAWGMFGAGVGGASAASLLSPGP